MTRDVKLGHGAAITHYKHTEKRDRSTYFGLFITFSCKITIDIDLSDFEVKFRVTSYQFEPNLNRDPPTDDEASEVSRSPSEED